MSALNTSDLSNITAPTNNETTKDVKTATNNTKNEKQKIFKLKEGQVLRYKKRLFASNWQPATLTLMNNGTFLITTPKRSAGVSPIQCQKNSTLIIFGQSLEYIPKRPLPANGYKKEHMLAIGLINYAYSGGGKLKGVQVIFYWFSLSSLDEMIEWVVAFQNSLYSDSHAQNMKSNPDIQTLTNNIALTNAYNVLNLNSSLNPTLSHIDELSYGLLMGMANTMPSGAAAGLGSAVVAGAGAGVLANQLMSGDLPNFFTGQNGLIDQLNPTRRINQYLVRLLSR